MSRDSNGSAAAIVYNRESDWASTTEAPYVAVYPYRPHPACRHGESGKDPGPVVAQLSSEDSASTGWFSFLPRRASSVRGPAMPIDPVLLRDRAKSRLRENLRQASFEGADQEQLREVIQAIYDDELSLHDANGRVLDLRRQARARQQAA